MSIDRTWATQAVETCISLGIDHFFIAPGSRCTPLTLAVAQAENATVAQHFDERGLAFATLGYGRATGKPGVFICTSGTAVANAFPAVIEASMDCVPMLLFTADRPPELRGTGANQTIDQRQIFGSYPRWFLDVPVPNSDVAESFVAEEVGRAIDASISGPIHLNWMFREPFTIDDTPESMSASVDSKADSRTGFEPSLYKSGEVGNVITKAAGNTVIALGGCRPEEANSASALARLLNAPLVTDITSGLRKVSPDVTANWNPQRLPAPDTVVHVGGRIVSKAWLQWTDTLAKENPETKFIHVTPHDVNINPNHLNIEKVVTSLKRLGEKVTGDRTTDAFQDAWLAENEDRRNAIENVLTNETKLSEPLIANTLSKELTGPLFLGNSTPIRDMDWYGIGPFQNAVETVSANRGASGIDGLLATAVGFAKGLGETTTVLLGDLSALHDLNSLAMVKQSEVPLIVLIINNQGGHIFDLLPVSKQTKHFEQYFATPHPFGFKHGAEMFGLDYLRTDELATFMQRYRRAQQTNSTCVIELITDRKYNMEIRQRINSEIQQWNAQN